MKELNRRFTYTGKRKIEERKVQILAPHGEVAKAYSLRFWRQYCAANPDCPYCHVRPDNYSAMVRAHNEERAKRRAALVELERERPSYAPGSSLAEHLGRLQTFLARRKAVEATFPETALETYRRGRRVYQRAWLREHEAEWMAAVEQFAAEHAP